ncbi:MAG TPA: MarR family winged helix-turn-helix transcriptional regulator [Acidobacteriaceae bacterium]|nr:MarR family winged helix-turn-helix transcriptional regulator [Acidobacteriaceae bacterium]
MSKPSIPALPCMCASFRRASRALTQRYDEAMRPLGLTGTQFTILQVLTLTGEIPQGKLGEILAMDSTTLTRTLKIISRHGWIATRRGKDRRERWLRLSPSGEAEFRRARPHWERAQEQTRAQLGDKRWKTLMNLINEVTAVVAE